MCLETGTVIAMHVYICIDYKQAPHCEMAQSAMTHTSLEHFSLESSFAMARELHTVYFRKVMRKFPKAYTFSLT